MAQYIHQVTRSEGNEIITRANQINFYNILSDDQSDILRIAGLSSNVTPEFLFPPLLTAIASFLNHTTVTDFPPSKRGVVINSGLVGYPSTGKSAASNLIRNAIEAIESYENIQVKDSRMSNAPTIESIWNCLENNTNLLVIHDETSNLISRLGAIHSYDRSILQTLFSCPTTVSRDIKSRRSKINNPRLNMHCNFLPNLIATELKNQRLCIDDGFYNQVLMSAPPSPQIYSIEKRQIDEPIVSLNCLLYFIKVLHKSNHNYTFDQNAEILIDNEYNLQTQRISRLQFLDTYLAGLIGKSFTQLIRICVILKALKTATSLLIGAQEANKDHITSTFAQLVERLCSRTLQDSNKFIIDNDTVVKAINCIEYFNKSKLILSGYIFAPNVSFSEVIKVIVTQLTTKRTASSFNPIISNEIVHNPYNNPIGKIEKIKDDEIISLAYLFANFEC